MFDNVHEIQLIGAQAFLAIAGLVAGIRLVDDINFWRNRKTQAGDA